MYWIRRYNAEIINKIYDTYPLISIGELNPNNRFGFVLNVKNIFYRGWGGKFDAVLGPQGFSSIIPSLDLS